MYTIGGFDLLAAGAIPIRQGDSNIALSGFLDMPARIGKTEHDWAEEHGVEPYVSAGEIFFGGRSLGLSMVVTGNSKAQVFDRVSAISGAIDGFTGLVPLVTPYGTYQVYVDAAIKGEYLPDAGPTKGVRMVLPMREPVVTMDGEVPAATGSEFGIDGISFASMGGELIELSGDRWGRPAPKSEQAQGYGFEPHLITKRFAGDLLLKVGIKQATMLDLQEKVAGLAALFASPGLRSLTVANDKLRSFYIKEGFKATRVWDTDEWAFALIECVLTESGVAIPFQSLIDDLGDLVLDNEGNTIKIRV